MNDSMLPALGRMAERCRCFVYLLTWNAARARFDKKPIGSPAAASMSYAAAHAEVMRLRDAGQSATVGLWIAADSGLFFLDIDALPAEYTTDDQADKLLSMFPGAYMEWSVGKRGLHVVGRMAASLPHSCRNDALHLEFYTKDRGVALNIDAVPSGCMDSVHDVSALVAEYFPPRAVATPADVEPVGIDDDDLIQRALNARSSAAAAFGGKASFAQLWNGEAEKNSEHDAALAAHLAFWTGRDSVRIERLMLRSGMVRAKWTTHRTYLATTIHGACAKVTSVYKPMPAPVGPLATDDSVTALSELSNAYRMKRAHGADLLAVEGIGWHVWSNGPWLHDPPAVHRLAFGLSRVIQGEADAMEPWVTDESVLGSEEAERRAEIQKNRQRWARASESRTVINNSLALLQNMLPCDAATLDARPMLVGCPGGVIDLATCTMREHRREDRITKAIACDYDPAARAPQWERFIHEVMGGDAELIGYLQTLCGYILSGARGEHILPILYGTGANGKSTFLTTLQTVMGHYACVAAPGLLVSRGGSEHPTGLAALQGRRLAVVSETGEGGRLNEEQVKSLTGGDRIAARRMRQDFYEFDATHVIVLQTNHKPRVVGNDEGIWRRLKLVPFTQTIPAERRDPDLPSKLAAELPGILAWVVEGWRKYQARGFVEPRAVRAATAEYRNDSDHVGAFLAERCAIDRERTALATDVYIAYKLWCEQAGERPLSQRTLGLRLAERPGIEQARGTGGVRTWRGLAVDHAARLRLAS